MDLSLKSMSIIGNMFLCLYDQLIVMDLKFKYTREFINASRVMNNEMPSNQ